MSRLKEFHPDFSNGLNYETGKETLMFILFFKSFGPNIDNIEDFKKTFDWYHEQYIQMLESDEEEDFTNWIGREISRQKDLIEHNKFHTVSNLN
ncbi:MAG: hypothetical protein WAT92_00190 [Saprospiraceae bacterium]